MRATLLNLLRCPVCRGRLEAAVFAESLDDSEVIEGELTCGCGASYPVIDTIPRMLPNAYALFPEFAARYRDRLGGGVRTTLVRSSPPSNGADQLLARTQRSFGYQWTAYAEMVCDFRENFWNYLQPATPEFFRGKLGLDAGCGFGRHIYHAAACGAEMVGLDFSRAIDSARRNTCHLPNVHLVQADLYHPPFAEETFDFVYSLGVLHHLPDPGRGAGTLATLVKPEGSLFVWLYSSKRRVVNFLLERVRTVTTRLPYPLLRATSRLGAIVDWFGFVLPYQVLTRVPGARGFIERLTPARVKVYSRYPFQVLEADWFDRLAAPVRFYYDEQGAGALVREAGFKDVRVSATGLYGWRMRGLKPLTPAPRDMEPLVNS